MQKKVTLSLDRQTYHDFQSFCNERAIMLSKRVEIVLRHIIYEKDDVKISLKVKNNSQKVTLSIDGRVYLDFKNYCNENGIMLSKKIEMIMKKIMEEKN